MTVTRMTPEGQLTIPKEVLDVLGWTAGSRLALEIVDGALIAKVDRKKSRATDLAGMLGKPPRGGDMTIEEVDEAIGNAIADHVLGPR